MTPGALVVLAPLLAAALLAAVPRADWRGWISVGASVLGFGLACRLPFATGSPDPLAVYLTVLTGFIALTIAWFARSGGAGQRFGSALFQATLGFLQLAALSDNAGLTWMALAAAVIAATAPLASRGDALLAGTALALALAGTCLLALAARPALGPGWAALDWNALRTAAAQCDGHALSLAFVFLLLGYGALAWFPALPSARGVMLGVSVANVAAVVLLRLHGVMGGNADALPPGGPMLALGAAALLLAAFGLLRPGSPARLLALSSVGQGGIVVFAFGLGGAAATFAGLLQMALHALVKAALLQGIGRGAGGDRWATGLVLAGLLALAGLPPSGLFDSQILLVVATTQRVPLLAAALLLGLGLAACAVLAAIPPLLRAMPAPALPAGRLAGAWVMLAAVLGLGVAMPGALLGWLRGIAAAAQ